jgi:hypothetical protein
MGKKKRGLPPISPERILHNSSYKDMIMTIPGIPR